MDTGRGQLGTMPRVPKLDDESYLDFIEGLRVFGMTRLRARFNEVAERALENHDEQNGDAPRTFEHAQSILDQLPLVQMRNRIMRSTQEMKYRGATRAFHGIADEADSVLSDAESNTPGTVDYDGEFEYPEYFDQVEFHIKPGSYHGESLAGLKYHYTTKMFMMGFNDHDEVHEGLVQQVPIPEDGRVDRVLDIACSIGQSSTALKDRFETAEVHAIDIAAPMLRYAHWRAMKMGRTVHFSQQLAEKLEYSDGEFDIVYAFILFHELPLGVAERVVEEAHRVLRPGGRFVVVDFPNHQRGDRLSAADYSRLWDSVYNGEPYAPGFVWSDFAGVLTERFAEVDPDFKLESVLPVQMRVATK